MYIRFNGNVYTFLKEWIDGFCNGEVAGIFELYAMDVQSLSKTNYDKINKNAIFAFQIIKKRNIYGNNSSK